MVGQLDDVLCDATAALGKAELAVYCYFHLRFFIKTELFIRK
jgi:hypothetical protein